LGFHLGSMMAEVPVVGLSKKQRKRRRDSRLGLRHLVEEMESNDSKAGASVYDTFHGAEQELVRAALETNTTRPVWWRLTWQALHRDRVPQQVCSGPGVEGQLHGI